MIARTSPQPRDLSSAREDYGEFCEIRSALGVVVLASAVASGLDVVVEGERVPVSELTGLVIWDSVDAGTVPVRLSADQAALTPKLVGRADRSSIELSRFPQGVSLEPLLDYLKQRVPTLSAMAAEMGSLRAEFRRRHPAIVEEDPSLLFF